MAEAMLRQRLALRNVPALVHSAGLILDHEPAHPHAAEILKPLGMDLASHRSRIVEPSIIETADLIIGMEQRHIREVSVIDPEAFDRSFTLPELVQRAEAAGPRQGIDVPTWLALVGEGRRRFDLLKRDAKLEVKDPMGGSKRVFRRTADSLGTLLDRFVALAWPEPDPSGHHGPVSQSTSPTPRST